MNHILYNFIAIFVFLQVGVYAKVDKSKWLKLECKSGSLYPPNDFSACEAPRNGNGFENCKLYCFFDAMGQITDDGQLKASTSKDWIDATFPLQYKKQAQDYLQECFNQYGNKIDYSDSTCAIANKMQKCAMGGFKLLMC